MNKFFGMGIVLASCIVLSGCPRAVRAPQPAAPESRLPESDMSGATVYEIAARESRVDILVYRGGTLARLGHNHVITLRELSGRAWLHPRFERSGFELSFPVSSLIVDDPQRRSAAGEDFPPEIPADDREGTRKNMLRAEVLDAEHHPRITLRSVAVNGSLSAALVTARVSIKGVSRDVPAQLRISKQEGALRAQGELRIRQTEFGIEPFSIALGALQVRDELTVRFEVSARQQQ